MFYQHALLHSTDVQADRPTLCSVYEAMLFTYDTIAMQRTREHYCRIPIPFHYERWTRSPPAMVAVVRATEAIIHNLLAAA